MMLLPTVGSANDAVRGSAVIRLFDAGEAPIKDAVRSVIGTSRGSWVVGSNELATYDGQRWQRIEVPDAYGFRALAEDRATGRVWVGAIDRLGYLEYTMTGWRFQKIDLPGKRTKPLGDIWSVHAIGRGAVWVGSEEVLRWDGQQLRSWSLRTNSQLRGFTVGDTALVHREGVGLLRFTMTGEPSVIAKDEDLPEKSVTWALPRPDTHALPDWIGLRDQAYRWKDDGTLERLDELSAALKGSLPTCAARLDDGRVAIGTFNAGIVIASADGNVLGRIGTKEGLPDDNVYALAGTQRKLLVGLPSGLVSVEGPAQVTVYSRATHLEGGMPRKVLSQGVQGLVLTSKGLLAESGDSLLPQLMPAALWWDAAAGVDSQLWLGGFGGLWRVNQGAVEHELHVATDCFQVGKTPRLSNGVLFTAGYDIRALVPSMHGGWAARELGVKLTDTPVSLVPDFMDGVWVSTIKEGITFFQWRGQAENSTLRLEPRMRYRPGANLPAQLSSPILSLLGGKLYALSSHGILHLRNEILGFQPVATLAGFGGLASTVDEGGTAYWLVQRSNLPGSANHSVLRVRAGEAGEIKIENVDVPGLDAVGSPSRIDRTVSAAGPILWIGGSRGLLRVREEAVQTASSVPTVTLAGARNGQSTRYEAETSAVEFLFSVGANGGSIHYQTALRSGAAGQPAWSEPRREGRREFSNLAPGDYEFQVRAMDRFGRPGPVTRQAFVVIAPWWRQPVAYVAYGLILALGVAGAARWRILRLKKQNEKLNQLVDERTKELQLSNTAKSEFLENISHEIRNPLNGLGGLLALLKEERMEPAEREIARSLKGVAGTLTRVFEDVLLFSKLEYGYAKLHPRPFRLQQALTDLLAVFAVQAKQQRCRLELVWPDSMVDGFSGDEERIKTIVGNFISNALKYAPGAPVEVKVEATEESGGMVDLYIDVTDHGPGIPADEQELIFKKFVRGSAAKRQEIAGTGLGLATSHVLARLMNGNIGVESALGKGSMFYLRLLLARATIETSPTPNTPGEAEAALVIDDEPYNRTVLEGIAVELGFRPEPANDATHAEKMMAAREYQVIFLDWELPDMKGDELAKRIRGRAGGDRPVILATTAHDSDEMQEKCRQAGMDGFLLKPFDAEKVRRAIEAVRRARTNGGPFWKEQPVPGQGLDLKAFEQYERAKPGAAARQNYVETLDQQLAVLTQAAKDREIQTMASTAHRLRALAGLIRAEALNEAARKLGIACTNQHWPEIDSAEADVRTAGANLKAQLGSYEN